MLRSLLWVLLGAFPALAQTPLPRDVIVLARVQQKVAANMARMPRYTCLETVERWSRPSAKKPIKHLDTLRLEVAWIDEREMFSWPGARSFTHTDPGQLIRSGTVSSGSFATHLKAAFLSRSASTTFMGDADVDGRKVFRYEYAIPSYLNRTLLSVQGRSGQASTKGVFWADPDSFDVLRMEIHAHEISPEIPITSLVTLIDYAAVNIGQQSAWLPQSVRETVDYWSGQRDENHIQISHCRAFTGESTLTFTETSDPQSPAVRRPPQEVLLPAGLLLPLELETEISSEKATAGDAITARLMSSVTVPNGPVLPKGAAVRGRLRMMQRGSEPAPHYVVGLEFTEIEFGDKRALFFAKMERAPELHGLEHFLFTSPTGKSTRLGGGQTQQLTVFRSATERYGLIDIPGISTFFMKGERFRIPAGVQMGWRTEALAGPADAR